MRGLGLRSVRVPSSHPVVGYASDPTVDKKVVSVSEQRQIQPRWFRLSDLPGLT
jgi:hypothetical protein